MGWTYPFGMRRADLVAERVAGWSRELPDLGYRIVSKCIAHCYRGSAWKGVLWKVIEHSWVNLIDGSEARPDERFIACDLLEYARHYEGWGYKDLSECMGPCEHSCPLGYLVMVPLAKYGGNETWRAGVLAWHEHQATKLRRRRHDPGDSEVAAPTRLAQAAAECSRPVVGVA